LVAVGDADLQAKILFSVAARWRQLRLVLLGSLAPLTGTAVLDWRFFCCYRTATPRLVAEHLFLPVQLLPMEGAAL